MEKRSECEAGRRAAHDVKSIFQQFVLTEGSDPFKFHLPGIFKPGRAMFGQNLTYDNGDFIVHPVYYWDGNSCKWQIGPVVIGISDGPLKPDGTPMGRLPSLGHDIIYEHIWRIAAWLGVSVWTVRAAVDRWFFERWLIEGQRYEAALTYYRGVRAIGWALVLAHKHKE